MRFWAERCAVLLLRFVVFLIKQRAHWNIATLDGEFWNFWIWLYFVTFRFGSVQFGNGFCFFSSTQFFFRFWFVNYYLRTIFTFTFLHMDGALCGVAALFPKIVLDLLCTYMQSICVRFPFVYQLLHTTDKSQCSFKWKVQFRFFLFCLVFLF